MKKLENEEVKVTDMTETQNINPQDWLMIVQNGINKKIYFENIKKIIIVDILTYEYSLKIDSNKTAGEEITIPCYYKVGSEVIDVYLNGERLIKSTDESGTDGHYCEIGNTGSISNKIKTTTDWSLSKGDVISLVVRGDYNET